MSKVLVLYYSAHGHIEAMAEAIADGARSKGATVHIKRVPEIVPEEVARAAGYKLDQAAVVAEVEDLANYDAIIVGTGTRFGRISSQMAAFLDKTGGLWARGALNGKVGAAFSSSAMQHGGQETTLSLPNEAMKPLSAYWRLVTVALLRDTTRRRRPRVGRRRGHATPA